MGLHSIIMGILNYVDINTDHQQALLMVCGTLPQRKGAFFVSAVAYPSIQPCSTKYCFVPG